MYTTKFETFLFDQILKKQDVFLFIKLESSNRHTRKTINKIKLKMNEHDKFQQQTLVFVCLHLSHF